jgi:TonB dependent receptor
VRDVHTDHYGFFVEDDYRMTPRLTVNLGLRYELATVLKEKNNEIGVFDPNSPQGFVQVGNGISSPFNGDHNNFSPRAGVAWDINGKTVVRAGASMLYEYVPFSAFMNSGGNSVGLGKVPTGAELCVNGACTQGTGNIAAATFNPDPLTLSSNWKSNGATPIFPTGAVACGDGNAIVSGPASLIGLSPVPCTTASFAQNLRTPYIITWNFDIQRAITNNLSLDLAYLGNHGVKLYGTRDINTPPLSAGYSPAGLAGCAADPTTCGNLPDLPEMGPYSAKFPYIQYILELSNMYRSHYNAVQATLTERTSHGLSFTAAYTYSHALDDVSQNFGSTTPLDNANPGLNYGNSDYDIRHRFTLEATYALPGMKSPGQMLEGWQLNSIVTLQTGQPWAVQDTANDFSGTGEVNNPNSWGEAWNFYGNPKDFTASPNGIPFFSGTSNPQCLAQATKDGAVALASLTNNGCFANGSSILIPPAYGTFGTIGKNIFRDTPFRNWDLSVTKSWKFKERFTAQFRAEFFNVLNHPLFADVGAGHLANNDPSTGLLGLANETPDQGSGNAVLGSGAQREIQLGLKLIF